MSARRSALLRLGAAALGALVVVLLVRALGPSAIFDRLRLLGGGFALVLLAYLAALLLFALPLGLLLPRRPSLLSLAESRFAAVAVNAATPFLGVGGEPVRLLWLSPPERRGGTAALVIDRFAFLTASALFLIVGALASARLPLPFLARVALPSLGALSLAAATALYLVQRQSGVLSPLARLLGVVSRRRAAALLPRARAVDEMIRALHLSRPGRVRSAIAIHLAARFVSVLEIVAIARGLHLDLPLLGALIFASVPLAVDLVFGMIPSQVGVHEGSSALLASALGLDPAAGLALAFVQRLRQLVFVTIGFALLAARRAAATSPLRPAG